MKGMTGGESFVRASRYTRWFQEGSWEGRSQGDGGPRSMTRHTQHS